MTPFDITNESLAFLNIVLTEANQSTREKDLRSSFIYRHARNISDLADDVLHLESVNRSSASRIVVRPMLESLFRLAAALKLESFAAEKVIAEIEDEIERIRKWTDVVTQEEFQNMMDETIVPLRNFAQQLRSEHSVNGSKKWNVFDTAKLAELDWHYAQDYFLYSKYVHSTVSGIISQEHQISRGHVLQTTIFVVVSAAANVVQAIETQTPQAHIDEAERLIGLTIELVQQGAFRDEEPQ